MFTKYMLSTAVIAVARLPKYEVPENTEQNVLFRPSQTKKE
jgi:hypothetical protein